MTNIVNQNKRMYLPRNLIICVTRLEICADKQIKSIGQRSRKRISVKNIIYAYFFKNLRISIKTINIKGSKIIIMPPMPRYVEDFRESYADFLVLLYKLVSFLLTAISFVKISSFSESSNSVNKVLFIGRH